MKILWAETEGLMVSSKVHMVSPISGKTLEVRDWNAPT